MIPISTTTITIHRPQAGDPYEDNGEPELVVTGVRAVIGSPSGSELRVGGHQQQISDALNCDVVDLRHGDLVSDDLSDDEFTVAWVRRRRGFGLDHLRVGLWQVAGAASG